MKTIIKKKKNRFNRPTGGDIALIIILGIMALAAIFPFYQVVLLSFSTIGSYAEHPLYLWFHAFDLTGYKTLIGDPDFFSALRTTIIVTVVGTFINMFLSVTGAYVLSRKHLMGRKIFLRMITFTMLFGGGLIPGYLVIKSLGLVNTIWVLMLPCGISTYYLLIMKNYFLSLPESLLESARLDGANEAQILLRIIVPISLPFMATFFLFYAVARWNDWYLANIYVSKSALYPLQTYLRNVLISISNKLTEAAKQTMGAMMVSTTVVQMATIVVTSVPIICVYPFIQKHFVKGIMVGGIKE